MKEGDGTGYLGNGQTTAARSIGNDGAAPRL
jgi:hypothetical protein